MTPLPWTCSYHEATHAEDAFAGEVLGAKSRSPTLSTAPTASVEEAYRFSASILRRRRGVQVVLGGLLRDRLPGRGRSSHCDAVVIGEGEPVWHQILADAARPQPQAGVQGIGPIQSRGMAPVPRFGSIC